MCGDRLHIPMSKPPPEQPPPTDALARLSTLDEGDRDFLRGWLNKVHHVPKESADATRARTIRNVVEVHGKDHLNKQYNAAVAAANRAGLVCEPTYIKRAITMANRVRARALKAKEELAAATAAYECAQVMAMQQLPNSDLSAVLVLAQQLASTSPEMALRAADATRGNAIPELISKARSNRDTAERAPKRRRYDDDDKDEDDEDFGMARLRLNDTATIEVESD